MGQDLKDKISKLGEDTSSIPQLQKGHQARFEERLELALPQGNKDKNGTASFFWMKIAAVLVVALTVGYVFLFPPSSTNQVEQVVTKETKEAKKGINEETQIALSDVSPEFKKIEDFYMGTINAELTRLEITEDNKALIDSFMAQLAELDEEYTRLNTEVAEYGITEENVEAMIENLKLRLELLFKLKSKLNELKSQKNETIA
ncbi:hypothetical protein GCM10009117_04170 [Gangjinia marincola]|uniref:Anti-sigma factor n=1 Tax=Gangjinia marincola TaxID=578463 RepID=A0ABP3XPS5_9FLAO